MDSRLANVFLGVHGVSDKKGGRCLVWLSRKWHTLEVMKKASRWQGELSPASHILFQWL
jgi:hypothetical protein